MTTTTTNLFTTPITLSTGSDTITAGSNYSVTATVNGKSVTTTTAISNSLSYIVTGDSNNDKINFASSTAFNTLSGGNGNDTIIGSSTVGNNLNGGAGNDTLTGGSGNDNITANSAKGSMSTITDGNGNDNLYVLGAGNATITAGTGHDTFDVGGKSTTMITSIGQGVDKLNVSAGSMVTAAIASTGWTAAAGTVNNGTTNLNTAGYAINLSADTVTGSNGFTITDIGTKGTTIIGSAAADTINGAAGDTITGGMGADVFNIKVGTEYVTDLGKGADVLVVSTGATADATIYSSGWTATAATVNSGSATLIDQGYKINLSAVTSGHGFTINDSFGTTGATITGSSQGDNITGGVNDTILGGKGANVINGTSGDSITGGAGADNINIYKGNEFVTNLGNGADVLYVAAGATANATVYSTGWTATAAGNTNNGGAVNLTTAGFAVNLAMATGKDGFMLTDTVGKTTLVGSNHGDTITGAMNDTITGGNGVNTINGVSGDKITGGSGMDMFNVNSGAVSITNLGDGADMLMVAAAATANATIYSTGWTATSATDNLGTANLTTAGYSVNLQAVTSGMGFTITDTGSKATLTGTAKGNDVFNAGVSDTIQLGQGTDSIKAAAGDTFVFNKFNTGHAAIDTVDAISGYVATDAIQYDSAKTLTVGNTATGHGLTIDTSGNVTFTGTAPTTLATALADIAAAFDTGSHASGGNAVNGEFAFFKVAGSEYLYISSGAHAVSANDTVIQFVGVTTPVSGVVESTVGGFGHLSFTA